ncbi:MAG TPA: class I SAM-dependent methyltransferase [Bryobacteraceae bacterium]|nr:class I SAM-dependent methyltransferase [Bryobacteraceae bacterium]
MRVSVSALVVVASTLSGAAQQFGPGENLAPYIPTPQAVVEKMLEAGHIKPDDVVYDLGAGDGRIVITAAREYGAKAVGIEIQKDLCEKVRGRIKELALEDKVTIVHDSFLHADLSPATVVTMYLLTSSNDRLRPILEKNLKPGTRVVSNQFPVKGWRPIAIAHLKPGTMEYTIYVYEIGKTK